jgi:DNA-binding transcriptional LysR family regulator
MDISFDLLKTFLAVVGKESFTEAGRQLHLTQSAVSMQMKRLTEIVGRPLFDIRGKNISLSVTGELLVGHAKKILQAREEALAALSQPDLTGKIRLGSPEDYTSFFLPRILTGFAKMYPNVQFVLTCEPTPSLVTLLNKGELDISIFTAAAINGGERIHQEPVVWIAAQDAKALERDPLPLALYNYNCIYRQWAQNALSQIGRNYYAAFLSPSIFGILAAVRSGLAVAPVGRSIVPPDLRIVGKAQGLPDLPLADVSLHRSSQMDALLGDCLAEQIETVFSLLGPCSRLRDGTALPG